MRHVVNLPQPRELTYTPNAVRLMDRELGQVYGKGFVWFLQQMYTEGGVTGEATDMRFDVLVTALKYGLWHTTQTSDEKVCEWIDASEATEMDLWSAVSEAYIEDRGLNVEIEDEEIEDESEEAVPDPEAAGSPAT